MGKFLAAGIIQKETIVKVQKIPISYARVTKNESMIYSSIGGDAYNVKNALEWLGNDVNLLSMIGREDAYLIKAQNLDPAFVLPVLDATPAAVIFYDTHRKQQMFEDVKGANQFEYDVSLFESGLKDVDMVVLSNDDFCKPFIPIVKKEKKKLVVNFHGFKQEGMDEDKEFFDAADIIYVSDDLIQGDSFDAMKDLSARFPSECIILGMGKAGVLMYTRQDKMIVPYPSVHIKEVINTVGAGNALLSCFLHYYLKTNDYHEAIKYALMFAAYKIGYNGTSKGFISEEEMRKWYDLIWNRYN